jgi:NADH:ubiquinone oxidoreductase subunit F (NADH-binding)
MAGESAGQCGPCRFGLPSVADDVDLLARGAAGPRDLERLQKRLRLVTGRGACRHPDGTARLVASALEVFADEVTGRTPATPRIGGILPVPPGRSVPVGPPGGEFR